MKRFDHKNDEIFLFNDELEVTKIEKLARRNKVLFIMNSKVIVALKKKG